MTPAPCLPSSWVILQTDGHTDIHNTCSACRHAGNTYTQVITICALPVGMQVIIQSCIHLQGNGVIYEISRFLLLWLKCWHLLHCWYKPMFCCWPQFTAAIQEIIIFHLLIVHSASVAVVTANSSCWSIMYLYVKLLYLICRYLYYLRP